MRDGPMADVAGDGRRPIRRAVVLLGIGGTLAESRMVDRPQVVMTTIVTGLTAVHPRRRLGYPETASYQTSEV